MLLPFTTRRIATFCLFTIYFTGFMLCLFWAGNSFGQVSAAITASKAGTMAPDAKVLDADELFPFSEGVAPIKKGTAYALIDTGGNIILPFNKFSWLGASNDGFIKAKDLKGDDVLINKKGKVLSTSTLIYLDKKGYAVEVGSGKVTFIDVNGNRTIAPVPYDIYIFGENWDDITVAQKGNKYGFINRKINAVIPFEYNYASPFNEGLAVVGKNDAFGIMHYGFINTKGTVVIPLIYTIKPTDFYRGLAMVTPKKNDEFNFAYINKAGDIVKKVTKADTYGGPAQYEDGSLYNSGYAEWNGTEKLYIDSSLIFLTQSQFLKPYVLTDTVKYFNLSRGRSRYAWYSGINNGMFGDGILDLKTKRSVPAVFHIDVNYKFDEISNLVLARTRSSDPKVLIEGYINMQGVFVLVKGKGSLF